MISPSADEPTGAAQPQRRAPAVSTRDLLAVAALVVGSLVLPVVGWLVGIGLLWTSATWRIGEKVLATLVWPGGLAVPLALPLLPVSAQVLRSPGWAMALITVVVVAPIAVGGWLLLRARQRAAARQLTPPQSP